MRKIAVLLLAFLAAEFLLQAAPQVVTSGAIKFNSRASAAEAYKKFYVVSVIYPQLEYSVKSGEILTLINRLYGKKNVEVFALLPTAPEKVREFAANHAEFDFYLCSDKDLQTMRRLLGENNRSFSPSNIFNYAGKLLWSGDAVDLPMMTERITSGKYSEREEIQFSALVNSLRAALRTGNARMIIDAADKILARRPEQLSAVNAKAYALEISGDIEGMKKFFTGRIKRFPLAQENYFMYIDAAFRISALNDQAPEAVRSFMQEFSNNINDISALAWQLLTKLPFNVEAYKTALEAEKILKASRSSQSRVLATLALIEYRRCNLQEAQKLAAQARALAKTPQEKAFLQEINSYFQAVEGK